MCTFDLFKNEQVKLFDLYLKYKACFQKVLGNYRNVINF